MKFRINIYRKEDDQYILQNLNPRCFDYDISQLDNGLLTYPFGAPVYMNTTVWNKEWPLTHAGISGLSCGNYVKL